MLNAHRKVNVTATNNLKSETAKMKTTIPDTIATPEKAKAFFLALEQNGELFHIDDDATTIDIFTKEEGTRLNELLEEAFEALGQHELWEQMPETNPQDDEDFEEPTYDNRII